MAFDELVGRMAEKWREVPGGTDQQPRQFSDDLLQSSMADLLAWWERQFEDARVFRGWYWGLYGDALKGKRVLEIGSGLGFDAVQLASQGAAVTCCDIAPSNDRRATIPQSHAVRSPYSTCLDVWFAHPYV